ncbi:hypothetical protein PVAP13_4KG189601 [Panicum virgatum]|uniref:Uncharacterized protein n=1 Tax=Panicum virgatum TaxID=38727 RepID=A0A8T0TF41_PANVG|nr:hypothetical protein PVAP13_4KG189601 [Panicum virgatum]
MMGCMDSRCANASCADLPPLLLASLMHSSPWSTSPSPPQSLSDLDMCNNRSAIPNFISRYLGSDRISRLHNLGAIWSNEILLQVLGWGPDPARGEQRPPPGP